MTVSAVTSRGAPASFEHKDDRLRIILDSTTTAGERGTFTVAYHGIPSAGLRIGKNRHGERTFFSDNWPDKARRWLPMIDHPYDKATSEFHVTAPARYQVVSNRLLQEETDLGDGRRLTHWKQSVPIASWLNALGVAQFTSHHAGLVKGVPLESWVYRQDRDAVMPALENPGRRVLSSSPSTSALSPTRSSEGSRPRGSAAGWRSPARSSTESVGFRPRPGQHRRA